MKMSQIYIPTLKEKPTEAETPSHELLLRAGMIRRVAAGIYSFLPLGYRVVRRVEQIIREELEKAGAQEVHLPLLHPAELWKESGRWDEMGDLMVKLKDRRDREYCIGPTHEEVMTDLIRYELKSYKDLPQNFYQIQTKVRDEIRPRFGLLRAKEFSMKDAYSFHANWESLDATYQDMHKAYCSIFQRCGLDYRVVEADTGPMGGTDSHEFMVLAETGEDSVLFCDSCGYAANVEKAQSKVSKQEEKIAPPEKEEIYTPGVTTIEGLEKTMDLPGEYLFKSLLYRGEKDYYLAIVRGSDQLNENKLMALLGDPHLHLAEEGYKNLPAGFLGPQGDHGLKVVADELVMEMEWGVAGANRVDYHVQGIIPGEDFSPDMIGDIRSARHGEGCPRCEGTLEEIRGIEVGHIFKLGTKYSESMNAHYLDENGKAFPMIMGCYGIGVTRTVAAAIEQNHDENGIKWPLPIAPYQVILLTLGKDEKVNEESEKIYEELKKAGVEIIWDDRPERPGVKFNEADLLGIPLRITVGRKYLETGQLEIRDRYNNEDYLLEKSQLLTWVQDYLGEEESI